MRLFYALLRRKNMPNGHIHRGKDKIIKAVTAEDYGNLKRDFETEEQNMFFLRHPYLTTEQSKGHTKALGKPQERYLELISKKKTFYDNVTLEDRLGHLRYNENWE